MNPFSMTPVNPSGQITGQTDSTQLPTGLPTGPLVQSGSSVTPEFIAFMVAGLLVVGGLAYYLTRAPEISNEEARALAIQRQRRSSRARFQK